MGNTQQNIQPPSTIIQSKISLTKTLKSMKEVVLLNIHKKQESHKEYCQELQASANVIYSKKNNIQQETLAACIIKNENEQELFNLLDLRLELCLKDIKINSRVEYFNNHLKSTLFLCNYIHHAKIFDNSNDKYEDVFNQLRERIKEIYEEKFWEYFSYACIDKKANKLVHISEKLTNKKLDKNYLESYVKNFFNKNGEVYINTLEIEELYD